MDHHQGLIYQLTKFERGHGSLLDVASHSESFVRTDIWCRVTNWEETRRHKWAKFSKNQSNHLSENCYGSPSGVDLSVDEVRVMLWFFVGRSISFRIIRSDRHLCRVTNWEETRRHKIMSEILQKPIHSSFWELLWITIRGWFISWRS